MKKRIIIIISLIFILNITCQLLADQFRSDKEEFLNSNDIKYNIFYFKSATDKSLTKVVMYFGFCNDILQFVKESNYRFHAEYEIIITLLDKNNSQVYGKSISENIFTSSFHETNMNDITNRVEFIIEVVPDEYKLLIELTDSDTKKNYKTQKKLNVRHFKENEFEISDIIFTDNLNNDSLSLDIIKPNFTKNFSDPELDYGIFYKIYPKEINVPINLTYTIKKLNSKEVLQTFEETFTPDNLKISKTFNLKDQISKVANYVIIIHATQNNFKAEAVGKFSTSWNYFNITELSIQQSLKPLKEMVNSKKWEWVENADDSAKEVWLKNYWKQRDPTPETKMNELKDEFYSRVAHSNNKFSVLSKNKNGWETDRGKIYLKYGEPSEITRRSREMKLSSYHIWYYKSIERRFIFEDKSGNGDYILIKIE